MFTNALITAATTVCNIKRHSQRRMTVMTTAIIATVATLASSMSYAQLLGVGNTTVNLTIPVSLTGLPSTVNKATLLCTFQNSSVTTTGSGFTGGGLATVVPTSVGSGPSVLNGVVHLPLTVSSAHAVQQNVVIDAVFNGSKPDIVTCALALATSTAGVTIYPKSHETCKNPVTSNTGFPYMCVNEALGNASGDWAFSAGLFGSMPQTKISMPITY